MHARTKNALCWSLSRCSLADPIVIRYGYSTISTENVIVHANDREKEAGKEFVDEEGC